MRRNCNLELCLFSDSDHHLQSLIEESNRSPPQQPPQQQQQQLTIFYNGSICVFDVTEFQARNILMLANREMEDKTRSRSGSPEPASTTLVSPVFTPNGLSMKRSLQKFLQKRNHRIQATFPYNLNRRYECL